MEQVSDSLTNNDLKTFVQNVSKSVIRSEQSYNKVMIPNKEIIESVIDLVGKYTRNIKMDEKVVKSRLGEIIKNAVDIFISVNQDSVEFTVCNFLEELLQQINQTDKQNHFSKCLDIYYEILKETIGISSDFTLDDLQQLVKIFLPYLKLKIVIEQYQKSKTLVTSSVQDLLECISCPKILREDCYEILNKKLGSSKYDLMKFDLIPLTEDYGLLGNYFSLNITIKQDELEKVLVFFAKYVPTKKDSFGNLALKIFRKELFIYKLLIPKLKSLGIEDISNFAPEYFFSRANEVLILENMNNENYYPSDIVTSATYDWLVGVIKKLSNFHACSLILDAKMVKECGKNIGEIYGEFLGEFSFNKNYPLSVLSYVGTETVSKYLSNKLSYIPNKVSTQELKEKISNEFEVLVNSAKTSEEYFNVICHRDLWAGNILTKKVSKGGEDPASCIFIDFQLITYSPPAVDLLFVIYAHTDKATRAKYMNELINLYYQNTKYTLEKYGVDFEKISTYEKFMKMVDHYKSSYMLLALCYTQLYVCPGLKQLLKDDKEAENVLFGDREEIMSQAWNSEMFQHRIGDLVEELCEELDKK